MGSGEWDVEVCARWKPTFFKRDVELYIQTRDLGRLRWKSTALSVLHASSALAGKCSNASSSFLLVLFPVTILPLLPLLSHLSLSHLPLIPSNTSHPHPHPIHSTTTLSTQTPQSTIPNTLNLLYIHPPSQTRLADFWLHVSCTMLCYT